MLLFLFLLVAGQAGAEGSGQVLQIKNSKGETFSYKDRVAQEKEVFDIKDRSTQRKPWPFGPVPPCSAKVEPKESHDNFVAARLPGEWGFHQSITDFLKESKDNEGEASQDDVTLSFTDDPNVLADLTEDKCFFIAKTGRRVFAAGTFGIHSKDHGNHLFPYVLVDHDGTSAIVYWPSTGPTAIPMLVQMAPGVDSEHDLLIVGEDRVGKPFGLLHRTGVSMPGEEASKDDTLSTPNVRELTTAKPKADFNLATFLAEQGASFVVGSQEGHQMLEEKSNTRDGEEEEEEELLHLDEPQAEPEPMADIAAESGDDEQTQKNMTKVTDDPIVKMLVEEKDDDIQTDVTK